MCLSRDTEVNFWSSPPDCKTLPMKDAVYFVYGILLSWRSHLFHLWNISLAVTEIMSTMWVKTKAKLGFVWLDDRS